MPIEIKMPQLSDTMSSGKILAWKKKEGDTVNRGDILAEVETDKANLEIESFFQGTLLQILVPEQNSASVGQLIAVIGNPGESTATSIQSNSTQSNQAPTPPAAPKPQPTPSTHTGNGAQASSVRIEAIPTKAETTHTPQPSNVGPSNDCGSGRVKASPLAKKLAETERVDISTLAGSGPNGRIVRKDVEAALNNGAHSSSQVSGPARPVTAAQPVPSDGGTLMPLSKMRATIARRMEESIRETPHFYTTVCVEMDEVIGLRSALKDRAEFKGLSLNHFVIKASAYALACEPRVNAAYRQGQLYQPNQINIGIITAIEDGLLIPVIKNTDRLTLKEVVAEAAAAVARARAGKPNSTDLTGGTFSISNMGMYDVENFTAIINPGQGAVLAVSAAQNSPVVRGGRLEVGQLMRATLSVDHRIIDGMMAANFLKFFKEGLEHPALMLV